MVYINTNDPESTKYIMKFLRRKTLVVTKEFLKSKNVPEMASIPIYSEVYINKYNNLSQGNIMFLEVI